MTSTGNAKKRIFYYDFLRCFAILSVIACHVFAIPVVRISNFGSWLWYYSLFLNTLRDIAVPMFVLISGALLLDKKETLTKFTKKRINRVIIPYLVWTIIFILFTYMCSQIGIGKPNLSLESIISSVATIRLVGIPTYFWFVQMIFVVYIVIFILNKLNERYPNTLKIALVLGLIIIAAYNLNIIPLERPSNYPFYAIFAVIGYYLSKIDLK